MLVNSFSLQSTVVEFTNNGVPGLCFCAFVRLPTASNRSVENFFCSGNDTTEQLVQLAKPTSEKYCAFLLLFLVMDRLHFSPADPNLLMMTAGIMLFTNVI